MIFSGKRGWIPSFIKDSSLVPSQHICVLQTWSEKEFEPLSLVLTSWSPASWLQRSS